MTTTVDRARLARHEAGHVAAWLMSGRVPASVTIDWPEPKILGQMTRDLTTDGVNPDTAPDFILSVLLGPLAEAQPGWPPEWPLDENASDQDARQLHLLADFVGLTEEGWFSLVKQANEITKSGQFKHLVAVIASALERVDELSGEEIRYLVGPSICATYGIEPKETAPCCT
jgi:hypothetical protein